jgi:hypothetical protein
MWLPVKHTPTPELGCFIRKLTGKKSRANVFTFTQECQHQQNLENIVTCTPIARQRVGKQGPAKTVRC